MSERIYMSDIRASFMCSSGARAFFDKHGLSWSDFLKQGVSVEDIVATGDTMALQVVEAVRGRG